ncbi:uncharacterized protein LOC129706009 [Leucoraja erinacea]|uniref:uncharacterized protein LOC129706009 n=1 Tax=Leucoraja erinaceus TaxID=7782 RepID=UPI002455C3C3|nr:uncharacterized protein LOC129706009 [Leucoraja erinacea]
MTSSRTHACNGKLPFSALQGTLLGQPYKPPDKNTAPTVPPTNSTVPLSRATPTPAWAQVDHRPVPAPYLSSTSPPSRYLPARPGASSLPVDARNPSVGSRPSRKRRALPSLPQPPRSLSPLLLPLVPQSVPDWRRRPEPQVKRGLAPPPAHGPAPRTASHGPAPRTASHGPAPGNTAPRRMAPATRPPPPATVPPPEPRRMAPPPRTASHGPAPANTAPRRMAPPHGPAPGTRSRPPARVAWPRPRQHGPASHGPATRPHPATRPRPQLHHTVPPPHGPAFTSVAWPRPWQHGPVPGHNYITRPRPHPRRTYVT